MRPRLRRQPTIVTRPWGKAAPQNPEDSDTEHAAQRVHPIQEWTAVDVVPPRRCAATRRWRWRSGGSPVRQLPPASPPRRYASRNRNEKMRHSRRRRIDRWRGKNLQPSPPPRTRQRRHVTAIEKKTAPAHGNRGRPSVPRSWKMRGLPRRNANYVYARLRAELAEKQPAAAGPQHGRQRGGGRRRAKRTVFSSRSSTKSKRNFHLLDDCPLSMPVHRRSTSMYAVHAGRADCLRTIRRWDWYLLSDRLCVVWFESVLIGFIALSQHH